MTTKPTYNTTDHHNVNTLSDPSLLTITSHVGEEVDHNDHCCKDKYILTISNTTAAAATTTPTTTTSSRKHHLSTNNITKMMDQGISMDRKTHECDVADAPDDQKSILRAKNHNAKRQLSDTITLKTHECDDDDDDQKSILSMHNYNDKYMGLEVRRRRDFKLESSGFPEPSSQCILENMWLRKQEVEARKEAEEWMLDCALQRRLMISDHQTQIRSVKAIVEAFQNVMHIKNDL